MKGMRQTKSTKSTKDRLKELEVANQNSQMALQMSQMMVKHITNQLTALQTDVGGVMGMSNDFQYRTLAMLELGNFNKDDVNAKAEELKLSDFEKASVKEDAVKGYEVDEAGIVNEDSIVIISSSTPDTPEDQGIFRSKFAMTECNTPALREKLLGAKVGDGVEVDIQGTKHVISILGLRFKIVVEPVVEQPATEQPVVEQPVFEEDPNTEQE